MCRYISQTLERERNLYRHCPSCESKNVVVYERGEDDSYCLDCTFTWRQSENYITVSRKMLEQIVGLKEEDRRKDASA